MAYAEIVASIDSKSGGHGTRANIDGFTETTSSAIVSVGGAAAGKAIIILDPAEPPLIRRDTLFCLVDASDPVTHFLVGAARSRTARGCGAAGRGISVI